jgi:hypothetical protein
MAQDDSNSDSGKKGQHPSRWFVLVVILVVALIGIGLLFLKV